MRPLAWLAGGVISALAMGIAQAQTLTETAPPGALLQAPLKIPTDLDGLAFDSTTTSFRVGGDLIRQNVAEVSRRSGPGSVDTFTLTSRESSLTPGGFASLSITPDQARDLAYDVGYARAWPGAVTSSAGRFLVELSPEARFGYGASGGSIGGGAMVRVMSPRSEARVVERLAKMGVSEGDRYGDQGRLYLFLAASGRAVGFNMAPGLENGWSTDRAALVGDAQVGLGWRKGDLQTSLGYMIRRVRVEDKYAQRFVDFEKSDEVVGLSFSYRPQPR